MFSKINDEYEKIDQTYKLCWIVRYIGLEGNEVTDRAAVEVVAEENVETCAVSRRDYKANVKKVTNKKVKR